VPDAKNSKEKDAKGISSAIKNSENGNIPGLESALKNAGASQEKILA
jgi:hypothetical protein